MNASILVLYLLCLLSTVVGFFLWRFTTKVTLKKWLITSAIGLITTCIIHMAAISSMTEDTETWSGHITEARHYSAWREYYEEAIYRTVTKYRTESYTDSKGKTRTHKVSYTEEVFDHWESRKMWHDEEFNCKSNINTSYDITKDKFQYFVDKYKNRHAVAGDRSTMKHASRMIDGDPNDYVTDSSLTHWIEPVTKSVTFENKVKASPSVFSFIKVNDNIKVYPYPQNSNPFSSDRLIGTANSAISNLEWDQMNAKIGPIKRVNVILVGFDSDDSMLGQYQESKWIGGKKNDIVICYGGKPTSPSWCYVFGWTESFNAKSNLQSIILEKGVNKNIIPLIEEEILKNYVIKDWKKFDYLTVEIPVDKMMWIVVIQLLLFVVMHVIEFKIKIDE